MITYNNCTRIQKNILRCIASYMLFSLFQDQLEKFKTISNEFYKSEDNNYNEHYNLYDDGAVCIEVAFEFTLTEDEIIISDNSDELWNAFFDIYYKHQEALKFTDLLIDNRIHEKTAEKVLNEWETFLKGYRCSNNKNSDYETT